MTKLPPSRRILKKISKMDSKTARANANILGYFNQIDAQPPVVPVFSCARVPASVD